MHDKSINQYSSPLRCILVFILTCCCSCWSDWFICTCVTINNQSIDHHTHSWGVNNIIHIYHHYLLSALQLMLLSDLCCAEQWSMSFADVFVNQCRVSDTFCFHILACEPRKYKINPMLQLPCFWAYSIGMSSVVWSFWATAVSIWRLESLDQVVWSLQYTDVK